MKILVADDDRISRRMLEVVLTEWGYEVQVACDGVVAWEILQGKNAPRLAILDWIMPEMDGLEVCRKVRASPNPLPIYLILLTVKGNRKDIVTGLQGGADDYIPKPFDLEELQARLQAGRRILQLQSTLAERVAELEDALARIKQLQGLVPMCAWCKKIRDDQNYWQDVEAYISSHTEARISHGICPDCCNNVLNAAREKGITSGTVQ